MKIIKKIMAIIAVIALTLTNYVSIVNATAFPESISGFDRTKTGVFPKINGTTITDEVQISQTYRYYREAGTAVFCTAYSLSFPTENKVCTLEEWSEPVKAGIAYIINNFQIADIDPDIVNAYNDTQRAQFLNKNLQATLAINQFLIDKNGAGNESRVLTKDGITYAEPIRYLDNTSKDILDGAKNEHDRVQTALNNGTEIKVELQSKSNGLTNINNSSNKFEYDSSTETNPITNSIIFKVEPQFIDSDTFKVFVAKGIYSLPENVSIKVYTSTNINNFGQAVKVINNQSSFSTNITNYVDKNAPINYVKFELVDSRTAEQKETGYNIEPYVYATGSFNYDIANNYYCQGTTIQNVTPNYTETEEVEAYGFNKISIKTQGFTVPNFPKLEITKVDKDNNNIKLEGAKFRITSTINGDEQSQQISLKTNAQGKIEFDDITAGRYCVKEMFAPDGYFLPTNNDNYCFDVNMNNNVITVENKTSDKIVTDSETNPSRITIQLENSKNEIELGKKDIDDLNGNYIEGATLKLTQSTDPDSEPYVHEGQAVSWDTSDELTKTLRGLPAGTYYLHEVTAPDGYVINKKPIKIVIKKTYKSKREYHIDNSKTKINIRKTDEKNQVVRGARLQITDLNGNIVSGPWTSSENDYTVIGLNVNTEYYLEETSAPNGYAKAEKIKFKLDELGNVIILEGEDRYDNVTVQLTNEKNTVKVSKKDVATNTNLANAKLQLIRTTEDGINGKVIKLKKEGNVLTADDENGEEYWLTTEEDFTIEKIEAGNYSIHELEAPAGYSLNSEDIKFTVAEDGTVTINGTESEDKIVIVNNLQNEIQISKTGKDGKALKDAQLQLLDSNNKVIKLKSDGKNGLIPAKSTDKDAQEYWVTTEEAQIIRKLPEGKYKVKEIKAPNGYVLSDEILEFEINKKGQMIVNKKQQKSNTLIMSNEETKVYISKQDITNKEELPGATLIVKDENGTEIDKWVSTNEPHLIEGLGEGTYTLTEITAPDGYSLNEETITFKIDANGALSGTTVMYNTPIPDVPSTFSGQSILFMAIGVILVSTGLGLYIYGIKNKKEI